MPSHWVEWVLRDNEALSTAICYHSPVWQAATLLPQALCSCWFELYGIAIFIGPKGSDISSCIWVNEYLLLFARKHRLHPQISPLLQAHFCSFVLQAAILHPAALEMYLLAQSWQNRGPPTKKLRQWKLVFSQVWRLELWGQGRSPPLL